MRRLEINSDPNVFVQECRDFRKKDKQPKQPTVAEVVTTPTPTTASSTVRLIPGPIHAQLRLTIPNSFLDEDGKIAHVPWEYLIGYGQTETHSFVRGRVQLYGGSAHRASAAARAQSKTLLNVQIARWLNPGKLLQSLYTVPGEIFLDPSDGPQYDYPITAHGAISFSAAYYDTKGTIEGVLVVNVSAQPGPYGIARNGSFYFDSRKTITSRVDTRHRIQSYEDLKSVEYDVRETCLVAVETPLLILMLSFSLLLSNQKYLP